MTDQRLCSVLSCAGVVTVQRRRGREDQAGGGHFLQQPAICSGDHQDQAEERLKVYFFHPGTEVSLHILPNIFIQVQNEGSECVTQLNKPNGHGAI